MSDAVGLLKTLKQSSVDAVEATKPVNVCFGTVTSASPLKINVEQKMTLTEKQLILCREVTEYTTNVTVNWVSESALTTHTHTVSGTDSNGDTIDLTTGATNLAHTHNITGKKSITVHNGLVVGDEVILLRQQGGQKYIVIDRVGA